MPRPAQLARLTAIGLTGIVLCFGAGSLAAPAPPRRVRAEMERLEDPYLPPAGHLTSQPARPRVQAATSVQVNVNAAGANILGDAANEPSFAIDPTNPNHMAIGWRQFDNVSSNFRQAGNAYSTDAGRTWHSPGVLEPGTFRSDPVLGYNALGNFFYASLTQNGNELPCSVFKSTNGGQTWASPPAYAFGGDKEWMTIDRTSSIGSGHVYLDWSDNGSVTGANTFTRSVNGGTLFPQAYGFPGNPQWGTLDVGLDGALYALGVDPNNTAHFFVLKSTNAKDRRFAPTFEPAHDVNLGGSASSFVSNSPNPGGLLGQAWLACDRSNGPTAGWVYAVCAVDPPGSDPLDVMFSRSTDGGITWSAPQRLNTDAAGAWQWFATMSVSPNGRIDVVWNDTRNTGLVNRSELFYSSSQNGGTNWTPNTRLSPSWDSWVGWPNQNKIGDYYHMSSDLVGANLAWSATFNGEQDVWFLRIGDRDCNGNAVGDSIDIAQGTSHDWNSDTIPDECQNLQLSDANAAPARFRLFQNVPNPFNPSTAIGFEVPAGIERVSLRIYDVAGHVVRALGATAVPGSNTLEWDGKDDRGRPLGSGIYLYRLDAPGFSASRRMVLVR